MFTLPLTEAMVQQHVTEGSWQRGKAYGRTGEVLALVQRGNALEGDVQGSEPVPYRIRCVHLADGRWQATCTCPYTYGGWCKHIVAACLTALRFPAKVQESTPLADQLSMLTQAQLVALVVRLAEQDPTLAPVIEGVIEQISVTSGATTLSSGSSRRPPPDLISIRRQVQAATPRYPASYSHQWGNPSLHTLQPILERACEDIAADDGTTALAVLESMTDPFVATFEDFVEFDEEGESVDILRSLGDAWLDAIVTAHLDPEARAEWIDKLADWQSAVRDYDDAFAAALAAAQQGWDFPPLQDVLRGETTRSIWPDEPPPYADAVTVARLCVLERRGQTEEYLRLAYSEGQTIAYAMMLVQVGRVDDAVAAGLMLFTLPGESLSLAQALFTQGAQEQAFQIAEHGLGLPNPSFDKVMPGLLYGEWHPTHGEWDVYQRKVNLAVWLREAAAKAGEVQRALMAAQFAYEEEISLRNFLRVQELAGAAWPTIRNELLAMARQCKRAADAGVIDVLLAENLIDDAIAALGSGPVPHELLAKMADATLPTRPAWVRDVARKHAEELMDAGHSKYYADAARWLERVRAACRVLGEDAAWRAYHAEILTRHRRKYTLRPLIEKLQ